ncbi:MAG: hypothetical protein BA863_04700 [Desulfovibrio sp. S3730MH75]|nr:MAG: hypothetical protein BA863_04700 [Desulfovibrio sp. S3730MH75]
MLSLFQNQTSLQIASSIIFPGILSIFVYNFFSARKLDWTSIPIEASFYGYINLIIVTTIKSSTVSEYIPDTLLALLIPTILGLIPILAIHIPWLKKIAPYPAQSAWNYAFATLKKNAFFCIVTLKDGTKVGGYMGNKSLVSGSFDEGDIYIQWEYKIDEDGCLGEVKTQSNGIVIVKSEISHISFIENK